MADKYITLENLETFKQKNDQKYQDKLTTTSVNDGTIVKNMGFDSQGNIVKETASGGGITDYQLINRPNSLPTASATSPDFVQYNGKLYRKQIAGGVPSVITDLTGTSWVLYDNISFYPSFNYSINFVSNSNNFDTFKSINLSQLKNVSYNSTIVYEFNVATDEEYWTNSAYKTIQITGGTDATNSTLINWLQANATMQPVTTYEYVEEQDALTTTSVNDGTIVKNMGFDSQGNIVKETAGGGGGTQMYLHEIFISINSFSGVFYLINDISTQITSISDCNNGDLTNYSGYTGSIVLSKITGHPFDSHTIDFKNCLVAQALGFAEDSDGTQIYSCTDTITAL